jgi:hypothetical protein
MSEYNSKLRPELALGFLAATVLWVVFLGWATSYSPNQQQKDACYQAAAKTGRSTEECKTFWEKTTSDPIATFTLVLAFSTGGLWIATIGLYLSGKRELDFIRAEFVANQRPQLIVRHVLLAADVSPLPTVILLGHDADATGGLSVVNVGGSDAHIVRAVYRIYFSKERLPARSPLEEGAQRLLEEDTVIKRGEPKIVDIWGKVDLGPPYDNSPRDIRQFETEGWRVYVLGEISYKDDGGAYHYMGFCRRRRSNGRFRPVKSPDYEYQD